MSKSPSNRQPSYRLHKASGQAVVTLDGKDIYLGRYGTSGSKEEYDRKIAEWLANGRRLPSHEPLFIAELIRRFWAWVEMHYRKDGIPTTEVGEYRYSLRPLNHLYGPAPASEFGPLKFKAVRQVMIDGYQHPKYGWQIALCRRVVNNRMERIKRLFRWATENELISPSVYHGLLAVRGLERGRTDARESEPVRPVPMMLVDAVRPFVSAQVQALIDLQLLTGARPGEVCTMRVCDLEMTGPVWIFRPESHKTEHHGQLREIYLGPRAQAVVRPFLTTSIHAYLFSPKVAEASRLRTLRSNRKSKVQPSQVCRKKLRPLRTVGNRYDVASYRRSVGRACALAFALPEHLSPRVKPNGKRETKKEWQARLTLNEKEAVRKWKRDHSWHPHQLRHNAATSLRKEFGVESARIILGHATAFTTEIYAETDRLQAMEVISKIG